MERVQFYQEQMLPEVKDLVKKGIFSPEEVKEIVKRRTMFETALVRRVADKADFLRYAQYEIGLEGLRKKRLRRLKLSSTGPSISDYAIVRRQYYIFERAVRKFKGDISLWIQYIQLARHNGSRALVARLFARALQLHPNSSPLYILAASHELSQGSSSSARTLLQRGLRFSPDSVELWTEYVKMELSYVERLRRRWDVLGIPNEWETSGEASQDVVARRSVMEGAVVKTVIDKATNSLRNPDLFESLYRLLRSYPSPLAPSLISYLMDVMRNQMSSEPRMMFLLAAAEVDRALEGDGYVDCIRSAHTSWTNVTKRAGEDLFALYAQWIRETAKKVEERNRDLADYLRLSYRKAAARRRNRSQAIDLLEGRTGTHVVA